MNSFEHWELAITPLSPVHLGTGREFTPSDYVIEDGALHEFDSMAALSALSHTEREKLHRILAGRPNDRMLREVQSFFHDHRERLMAVARYSVRVNESVEAFYKNRVGQVVQHESGGKTVQNRLVIERTAWTPAGSPIIPGSGLKGAIRTALLDQLNNGQDSPSDQNPHCKESARALEKRLLEGDFALDPLRLVCIADAHQVAAVDYVTEVFFAVNRKKKPVMRNGQLVQSQAEERDLYQLLECLLPFVPRVFSGTLSLQKGNGIGNPRRSPRVWPTREFTFQEIAAACNRFYGAHLERELQVMQSMGALDPHWLQQIKAVQNSDVGKALRENRAFLLRVGRHSGAESVTLAGVRDIKINRKKGSAHEYSNKAKTLWLAATAKQEQRALRPFGWILVEAVQPPQPWACWPALSEQADIGQWLTENQSRKDRLLKNLQEKQAAELKAQQIAEQEAAARKEQEARLAAMSEEERRINDLSQLFAKETAAGTLTAGSQVSSERIDLLREALQWEDTDLRQQAAAAIRETLRALPWSKKTKADRQADLARLEQPKDTL